MLSVCIIYIYYFKNNIYKLLFPIKKNGIVGIVVDVNFSDTSWYIVEDDEKKDGKYELYDCLEEELETIV